MDDPTKTPMGVFAPRALYAIPPGANRHYAPEPDTTVLNPGQPTGLSIFPGQADSTASDPRSKFSYSSVVTVGEPARALQAGRQPGDAGQMTLLSDPTVTDLGRPFLRQYKSAVERDEFSPHTLELYETQLRVGAMTYFPGRRVSTIEALEVLQMQQDLADTRGPTSANGAVHRLAHLIDFGIQMGLVGDGKNAARRVKAIPVKPRRFPLSAEDSQKLARICWLSLTSPEGTRVLSRTWAGLFLVLLSTGMRRNEATHLRREEWDSKNKLITISRDKARRYRIGAKQIPANDITAAVLDYIADRDEHPIFFFPSKRSRTGHVGDPSAAWKRLLRLCAVDERTRIHDIRHGFAVAAYEACKDIECVAGLLGHVNSRTTSLYIGTPSTKITAPTSQRAVDTLIGELKAVSR